MTPPKISHSSKIFVAGHKGMVGSAIVKVLKSAGYSQLLTKDRKEVDLLDQKQTFAFLQSEKPDVIIDAAAKVGGIVANNTYRADFIYQNIQIQQNLIWGAHSANVARLIFLGSSCIYPKECAQPLKEEYLLTAQLEETNRPYAIAKIAGIELVDSLNKQYQKNYVSLMPCNLYGPGDNYDAQNSHVIPALIRKFLTAKKSNSKSVSIWGSGTPQREFLHSDDLASAVLKTLELSEADLKNFFSSFPGSRSFLNVGSGKEITIKALAEMIGEIVGFKGEIVFDSSKPDGTLRKVLDPSKFLKSGWAPKWSLKEGLKTTIAEVQDSLSDLK